MRLKNFKVSFQALGGSVHQGAQTLVFFSPPPLPQLDAFFPVASKLCLSCLSSPLLAYCPTHILFAYPVPLLGFLISVLVSSSGLTKSVCFPCESQSPAPFFSIPLPPWGPHPKCFPQTLPFPSSQCLGINWALSPLLIESTGERGSQVQCLAPPHLVPEQLFQGKFNFTP